MNINVDTTDFINYEGCSELFFAELVRDSKYKCEDTFQWNNETVKLISKQSFSKGLTLINNLELIKQYFSSLTSHK